MRILSRKIVPKFDHTRRAPDSNMAPVYSNYEATKSPRLGLLPSSILFR
jgi:hypothetical protein